MSEFRPQAIFGTIRDNVQLLSLPCRRTKPTYSSAPQPPQEMAPKTPLSALRARNFVSPNTFPYESQKGPDALLVAGVVLAILALIVMAFLVYHYVASRKHRNLQPPGQDTACDEPPPYSRYRSDSASSTASTDELMKPPRAVTASHLEDGGQTDDPRTELGRN